MARPCICSNPPLTDKDELARDILKVFTKGNSIFTLIFTASWAPTLIFTLIFTLALASALGLLGKYMDRDL